MRTKLRRMKSENFKKALLVTFAAVALGLLIAFLSCHWKYDLALQTVETCVEIFILGFVVVEGLNVVGQVRGIYAATVRGFTTSLQLGDRVHVLDDHGGKPRADWTNDGQVWRVTAVDVENNTATATPVMPSVTGAAQIVTGVMSGPSSPFVKLHIAG